MNEKEELYKNIEFLGDCLEKMSRFSVIKDTQITSYHTIGRKLVKFTKKVIRKMVYWLIKPYWSQQIEFNLAVQMSVETIYKIQSQQLGMMPRHFENENFWKFIVAPRGRIIQLVSVLNYGDAVGNDVMAIQNFLREKGYATMIFANYIHEKIPEGMAYLVSNMPNLYENDLVIYHFATGDPLVDFVKKVTCKVVLRYHNVTPPSFFKNYDAVARKNTKIGLRQIKELRNYIDYGLVDSEFNKKDLIDMGYNCPIYVAPILIRFDDYKKKPSQTVIRKYSDEVLNIIFVGRIAPNKKIEDVISVFSAYKKKYNDKARLFLVGNYNEGDKYFKYLCEHIKKIGVTDVFFTGHILFDEILGYYNIADVFLCMSEHEGFCVPLVEAMFFGIPIVAYDSTAVPYTLDTSGILVQTKDYNEIAEKVNNIVTDKAYRNEIIMGEKKRLQQFDNEVVGNGICKVIEQILCASKK